MNDSLAFWLAIAALASGMLLSAVRLALSELSPGTIRKLESSQPELAERFSSWYARKERYRITLRMLQICALAIVLATGSIWLRRRLEGHPELEAWLVVGAVPVALAYLLATEILGCGFGRAWNRQLLRVGMPITGALGMPFIILAWPIEQWHRLLTRHRIAGEAEEDQATTEDEIMSLVEKDEEGDHYHVALEEDERRMIRGIFDLDETLVREIMTPRVDVDAMPVQSSLPEVRDLIVETGHSRIPLYRETIDEIQGVIHAKDILTVKEDLHNVPPGDLMHGTLFIPESKNVGDLLNEFQENTNHFAVVVDEYGGTAGVVTLEDILEEIVGEIRDEYDYDEEDGPSSLDENGDITIDARTPICDINERFGLDIPDEGDYDTLGGYVSCVAGHIPKVGEVVRTAILEAEILEADERRVLKTRIRSLPEDESGSPTGRNGEEER
jgi:CBS domain containing-hemolysin-like protein